MVGRAARISAATQLGTPSRRYGRFTRRRRLTTTTGACRSRWSGTSRKADNGARFGDSPAHLARAELTYVVAVQLDVLAFSRDRKGADARSAPDAAQQLQHIVITALISERLPLV